MAQLQSIEIMKYEVDTIKYFLRGVSEFSMHFRKMPAKESRQKSEPGGVPFWFNNVNY